MCYTYFVRAIDIRLNVRAATQHNLQTLSSAYTHWVQFTCCPQSTNTVHSLQTLSTVYRHCPQSTGTIQVYENCRTSKDTVHSLQTLSTVHTKWPTSTDTLHSLQTLTTLYRHRSKPTDIVHSLQTLSKVYRHYPQPTGTVQSLQTLSTVYRNCPSFRLGAHWQLNYWGDKKKVAVNVRTVTKQLLVLATFSLSVQNGLHRDSMCLSSSA